MAKSRKSIRSTSRTESKSPVSPLLIGVVVVASLLLVGGLVWLGNLQTSNASATVDFEEFPAQGDAAAPVTIVEYSDYGCSHCRDFVTGTADLVEEEYVESGQVRYIVHPFNLGRPETALASEASWCAADQGTEQFFDYQHTIFDNFGVPYNQSSLTTLAEDVESIDQAAFTDCLSGRDHQNDVEIARQMAARQGISSTPTFFIGPSAGDEATFFRSAQKVEGNQPFETMQSIIEQTLAQAR